MGTSSAVYSRDAVRCLSSGPIVFRLDRRAYIPMVVYAGPVMKKASAIMAVTILVWAVKFIALKIIAMF